MSFFATVEFCVTVKRFILPMTSIPSTTYTYIDYGFSAVNRLSPDGVAGFIARPKALRDDASVQTLQLCAELMVWSLLSKPVLA